MVVVVVGSSPAQVELLSGVVSLTICWDRRLSRLRSSRVRNAQDPLAPLNVISNAAPVSEQAVMAALVTELVLGSSDVNCEPENDLDHVAKGLLTDGSLLQWSSTDFR